LRGGDYMTPKDIVEQYYDNLVQKNAVWPTLFADDVIFADAGMNINQAGKEAVTKSFEKFLETIEDIRVKQIITENENVCAIVRYSYKNSEGEELSQDVAEIWKVKDGKLSSLTIYFDITAYRRFMGA
jgi:ketosteroid isomerase-like protein